jgi:hypothetical protein
VRYYYYYAREAFQSLAIEGDEAVLYQRYKVMLYVNVTQQQISLEQGPVHAAK